MSKTVKWQGKEVQGTEVTFDIIKEDWRVYDLADGTVLRIKDTLMSVMRLAPEFVPENEEIFYITQNATVVRATNIPEHLKKKAK